ncbi:Hypothetical predicted protein, partial [Olea europaea subsp. europaea]
QVDRKLSVRSNLPSASATVDRRLSADSNLPSSVVRDIPGDKRRIVIAITDTLQEHFPSHTVPALKSPPYWLRNSVRIPRSLCAAVTGNRKLARSNLYLMRPAKSRFHAKRKYKYNACTNASG